MTAADPMRLWMLIALAHGVIAIAGAGVTVYHLLAMKPARADAQAAARQVAAHAAL